MKFKIMEYGDGAFMTYMGGTLMGQMGCAVMTKLVIRRYA